ncbi:hypothetical protein DM02DRAFT_664947 [Periconia macrospinosa]|uniref:Uncharacterized protein n=1 Tax=Periconia macrospinosa TaxID=97972 RepID=A0A2V1CYI3_9PLEO|nr:hypothetical protein DM02DRAFT_664947 [Periconia macrospinosa]
MYPSLRRRCEEEAWISGNEDAAASNKGHDEHSADEGSSRTGNSSDESLEEENEDSGEEDWSDESSEDGPYESFVASGESATTPTQHLMRVNFSLATARRRTAPAMATAAFLCLSWIRCSKAGGMGTLGGFCTPQHVNQSIGSELEYRPN